MNERRGPSGTSTLQPMQSMQPRRRQDLDNRGQASLMMGMMMLTFILLFAFVVNVGMLVNAKINLQNAADLAAYSGAAVQARQLNHISFLNYEMKRQYKKFLFRYYVMGNLAYDNSPKSGNESGVWNFAPGDGDPYNGPVVCMVFNPTDNFCRIRKLRGIKIPQKNPLDMLQTALISNLEQMEKLRQDNCAFIGMINRQVLGYWLWNTDPELDDLASQFQAKPELLGQLNTIRGLTYGLGLIPRQLLLKKRIDTLNYYVNFPAQRGVTLDRAQALRNEGDVARRERTIQAFFSAYHTLGNHTFSDLESITMDEIEPVGPEGSNYLSLETVTVDFDTFYADVRLVSGGTTGGKAADCEATAMPMSVPGSVPVAVYKDPNVLTYYGVKLTAKAKVLFNPFGSEIELTAYSAAQPFGSRIGPVVQPSDFVTKVDSINISPEACAVGSSPGCQNKIPNVKLTDQLDWTNRTVMGSMYEQFFKQGLATDPNAINESRIDANKMQRAYHAAMAPTPIDSGKYNIPDDLQKDDFIRYFGNDQAMYRFWAPILSPDQPGSDDMGAVVGEMLKQLNVGKAANRAENADRPTPGDAGYSAQFLEPLTKSMENYIQKLRTGAGENGEGFNIVGITDPFHERPAAGAGGGAPPLLQFNPPDLFLSDPTRIRTSWSDLKDGEIAQTKRTGYSVKFVSFSTLGSPNQTSDRTSAWRNIPRTTSESMASDLKKIQH